MMMTTVMMMIYLWISQPARFQQFMTPSQVPLQKSSAIFLLGLKENFEITQVSLQGVIQGVTALTQQNISMLKSQVCTYLYFNMHTVAMYM